MELLKGQFDALDANFDVDSAVQALEKTKEALRTSVTVTWVPDNTGTSQEMAVPIPGRQLREFFADTAWNQYLGQCGIDPKKVEQKKLAECLARIMGAEVRLIPQMQVTGSQGSEASGGGQTSPKGLAYRQPGPARLIVCREACAVPSYQAPFQSDATLVDRVYGVAQFGIVGTLPLENEAFDNNTLEVGFSASGTINQLNFTTKAKSDSMAETFSKSAMSILETTQQGIKERREERAAQRQERQADLDASLKERQLRRDDAAAERDARLDTLRDRQALVEQLQGLEKQRAGTPSLQQIEMRDLENQRSLLHLQIEVQRLKNELAAEQAKAKP